MSENYNIRHTVYLCHESITYKRLNLCDGFNGLNVICPGYSDALYHTQCLSVETMDFGYRRVSTVDQNTDRQLDGVKLDKTLTDKISGSMKDRPELTNLLSQVRTGDTIHVHSIDRIARDLQHLQELIAEINGVGVALRFHKEGMTFDGSENPMQKMQMQPMGAVAEFERSIINERTREGREIAKSKGVVFGRKPKLTPKQITQIKNERASGKTANAIAIDFDISRKSVCRALSA